jgi:hypothetical protein
MDAFQNLYLPHCNAPAQGNLSGATCPGLLKAHLGAAAICPFSRIKVLIHRIGMIFDLKTTPTNSRLKYALDKKPVSGFDEEPAGTCKRKSNRNCQCGPGRST